MIKHHYIDGIRQLHFVGGMVRMDTFVLQPQQGSEPEMQDGPQLIMTPQGFLASLNAMQQLAEKLVENGVLQRAQQ